MASNKVIAYTPTLHFDPFSPNEDRPRPTSGKPATRLWGGFKVTAKIVEGPCREGRLTAIFTILHLKQQ